MSTTEKDAAQLEAELQAEKEATERAAEQAGQKAKEEAEDKGLSPEEVRAAVEKARKEEKDKLYPQLEALKNSIKDIQEVLRAEREEKEQIKKEAEEAAEKKRLEKLSDSDRHMEALKRIEEQLREEREARIKLEKQGEERDRKQRLANYRAHVLQAAGNEIIEEMVTGNTEAEIDASVTIAKARYAEIAERFRQERGKKVRSDLGRTSANPDTDALEEHEYNERLNDVDRDKYMRDPEYRKMIQNELATAYARAAGRA